MSNITIKRTHSRNLRDLKKHYQRFFIEEGNKCWYVWVLNGKITAISGRVYCNSEDFTETKWVLLPEHINKELADKWIIK